MDFDDIFQAYYSLFRADSDVPISTDDEYTVGMRLANEAINYWSAYDGTYWRELFTTLQSSTQVAPALTTTITTGVTSYTCPTDFKEAGGYVKILDSNNNIAAAYPIIEPNEVQFQDTNAEFCYFTGNRKDGYIMHINPEPTSNFNGYDFDYVYYKKPTEFTTGTDKTEMSDPYFIVHRMLAMQFRAARNPYYQSALKDAENNIRVMQLDNNSGTWANPWGQTDNSGTVWGW